MTRKTFVRVILVLTVVGVVLVWAAGSVMLRGQSSFVAPAQAPAQYVTLSTADGLHIAATYRPGRKPDAPAVLLLHGIGASRAATAPNAAWLASQGYATLAIDFRGHGQWDMAERSLGLHEALDARAAFDWLKRRQHGAPVAIIGASLGGAAALIGDDGPIPADALILQAVYPSIRDAIRNRISSRLGTFLGRLIEPLLSYQSRLRFGVWPGGLTPATALRRYGGPVMIVGGMEDAATPPAETRRLASAATNLGDFWLAPHGDHAAITDLNSDEYHRRVAAFLTRTIGSP